MSHAKNPIRIGVTFRRKYRRWQATASGSADTNSPIDFSGSKVTFNLKIGGTIHTYGEAQGVIANPTTGEVTVEIPGEITARWPNSADARSWLAFTDTAGRVTPRCHLHEKLVRPGD
jgi:hypothetical protein